MKKTRSGATNVARKRRSKLRSFVGKSKRGEFAKPAKEPSPPTPVPTFHVHELDPVQKCGAATSVQRMFRIDEANGGVVRAHLVFYDRHGLYCEHGRDCPAVPHARSVMAHDDRSHIGPTHNGRMRA